jgi:hypothetical protein
MDDSLQEKSKPEHWLEVIRGDLTSPERKRFTDHIAIAKELIKNEIDLGITQGEEWYKRATYVKILQHVTGRMLYGPMIPKFTGVEEEDIDIAKMYQAAVYWEFTRPRGLHNKIGRRQMRPAGENWINYGLGCMNTYFSPRIRTKENFTGSIITEAIDSEELILDHNPGHIDNIMHVSRQFPKSKAEIQWMFPRLSEDEIPADSDGRCWLYEIQFRMFTPIKARMINSEVAGVLGNSKYFWQPKEKDIFLKQFAIKTKNGGGESAWKSMKTDYYLKPMVYQFYFLASTSGETKSTQKNPINALPIEGPTYIGSDFTYTLMPFLHQPDTPYPAGAAFFVYDDQRLEALLMTLYTLMIKRCNNSGRVINLDKIVGSDDAEKIEEVRRFREEIGYDLLGKDFQTANEIIAQLKWQEPTSAMLDLMQIARYEANEYFNTQKPQTGEVPFAGASGRLVQSLQTVGSVVLMHMNDSLTGFVETIFRKIANLCYEHMPRDKMVSVSDLPGNVERMLIQREKLRKYNPLDLDIIAELDTTSVQEKMEKEARAMALYDRNIMGPLNLLKELGYRRGEDILAESQDHQRGNLLVALEKENPEYAAANNEYINARALEKGGQNAR